jgi:hypothetical protein
MACSNNLVDTDTYLEPDPDWEERMISLHFEALQAQHSVTVGPAEGFRIAGNFLRKHPGNEVLGYYSRHQWHVRDGHFSRYDCREPAIVYFADTEGTVSEAFGPFEQLHVADGTMYTRDALFAKFIDESVLWHSFELENYWPNLIISSPL